MAPSKVLLGMSGGTDSSVAAMLLLEQGHHVIGVTFRLWSEVDDLNNHTWPEYLIDAAELAKKLGIEHHIIDVREYFYTNIIEYFVQGYLKGQTPNPCAKCNVVLKWKLLDEYRETFGCDKMATGHYVQTTEINGQYFIKPGIDPDKEQSFFLWGLSSEILQKARFPIGHLTKSEVRQIAIAKGFEPIAKKTESIGVCFIKGDDYRPFLMRRLQHEGIEVQKGKFIDHNGNEIGQHQGYPYYTIGQRRGLGLNLNQALYVTNIDSTSNIIKIGNSADLYQETMLVAECHFNYQPLPNEVITTRIRYRKQSALSMLVFTSENEVLVRFKTSEWSIAPGQTAAFYKDGVLIGGGFIK